METIRTINISKDYKVIVGCMTYNHSKYIVDALNGFAMQKTNFPFACIVMDDASTDGEQEVIKNWLHNECDMARAEYYDLELSDVIIVPHKENANCTMAVYFLKRNFYQEENLKFGLVGDWVNHCEYIALCEGDDYWIDQKKLQIQTDCLDAHPEVDMCAHSYREVSAISGRIIRSIRRRKKDCIVPLEDVITGGGDFLATDSIVYRISLENNIPAFRQYMNYDYSLYIHGAQRGGILYIDKSMSVYRRLVPNSWSGNFLRDEEYQKQFYERIKIMLNYFNEETACKYSDSIGSALLVNSIVATNSRLENAKTLINNLGSFIKMSFRKKMAILSKCFFPKIGHRILEISSRVGV